VDPGEREFMRKALAGVVNDYGTGGAASFPGSWWREDGHRAGRLGEGKMIKSRPSVQYRDHAWFVAFAPVDDPQIVVAAMVEHGGHGGSAAAPIVKA